MTQSLQDSVKKKLIKEYNAYKNDTKHNHGFSLRSLIKNEEDPKWGLEWTAKIYCTDEIFMCSKFVLKITLSSTFPISPPTLRFMPPIPFHPNVSQSYGSLCYQLLTCDWQKNCNISLPALITNIAGFLANPNFPTGWYERPCQLYYTNPEEYYAKVKELSKTHT